MSFNIELYINCIFFKDFETVDKEAFNFIFNKFNKLRKSADSIEKFNSIAFSKKDNKCLFYEGLEYQYEEKLKNIFNNKKCYFNSTFSNKLIEYKIVKTYTKRW